MKGISWILGSVALMLGFATASLAQEADADAEPEACPWRGDSQTVEAPCPGTKADRTRVPGSVLACPKNVGPNTFTVGCLTDDTSVEYVKVLFSLAPGEQSLKKYSCPRGAPIMAMRCQDATSCEDSTQTAIMKFVVPRI